MDIYSDNYGYIQWDKAEFTYKGLTINLQFINNLMKDYLSSINASYENNINSLLYHSRRYLMTIHYIIKHDMHHGIIFEAGQSGYFTFLLQEVCGSSIIHTDNNLQNSIAIEENYIDNILCMEVFEHISDGEILHEFEFLGIFKMLTEFYRILKPHGKCILTTPNACGLYSFEKILQNRMPFSYAKHVREYSPNEIKLILNNFNFTLREVKTENVFVKKDFSNTLNFLKKNGFSYSDRGEDIVCIFEKSNMPNKADLKSINKNIIHL